MHFRPLGNSGLMVSVVGLGANNFGWRLDLHQSRLVLEAGIEAGINLVDTSDSYDQGNSEQILGEVLKDRREEVVIATKFGSDMGGSNGPDWGAKTSRRYIARAVEASLRRLNTDWIDLYQLHRPDGLTPLEETLEALDDLVHQGKIRYAGSSNLAAWQVTESAWIAKTRGLTSFVSAQNHYSLLERKVELELVPVVPRARNIGHSVFPARERAADREMEARRWRPGEQPAHGPGRPERADLRCHRRSDRTCRPLGHQPHRARDRGACSAAGGCERDRRRHLGRTGAR